MSTEHVAAREVLLSDEPLSVEAAEGLRKRLATDRGLQKDLLALASELAEETEAGRTGKKAEKDRLACGVSLWLLGRYGEALEALEPVRGKKGVGYYVASCLSALGRWQEALDLLSSMGGKPLPAQLLQADLLAKLGQTEEAQELLEGMPAETHRFASYWAVRGFVDELAGDVSVARELYHRALEIDEDHPEALFRLAYSLDLSGDDEQAIELYERCAGLQPTYVNALVNLGVLYEDNDQPEKAVECYQRVLDAVPTHERARLFLKGAEATLSEVVDEAELKRQDQLRRVLSTPITDFELSVRSQKCLEQMDIRTLGDLTRITEQELLSKKNFGETSLAEIKAVMAQKGLRLGQALEEGEIAAVAAGAVRSREQAELESKLAMPLTELDLGVRSQRAMEELGLYSVGDLIQKSEADLMACRNFGQVSLTEVREKLGEMGLRLKSGS
jgi:DNA-directed RNA polymerase subunit alpha